MTGTLELEPPERMYTVPESDVQHWISDADLAVIKGGASNHLYHLALAFFGGAIGFAQNAFTVGADLLGKKPPSAVDIIGALLFVGFAVSCACLFSTNRSKENPLKTLVTRIEARQRKPFKAGS